MVPLRGDYNPFASGEHLNCSLFFIIYSLFTDILFFFRVGFTNKC